MGLATSGGDSRLAEDDFPSSSAPPLGLTVAAGGVVGDVVGYGLAVAVARGVGDAAVGRGEAVVAGDALWLWAELETIAAPTTASVAANRRDVFTSDKRLASN